MVNELVELNQIRLDEDLTYETLAGAIGIERTTLLRLLSSPNRRPMDRTLHKIRRYLEARKPPSKSGTPKRRMLA
jgi:transcriptional regulator with XRE-family HTH domain